MDYLPRSGAERTAARRDRVVHPLAISASWIVLSGVVGTGVSVRVHAVIVVLVVIIRKHSVVVIGIMQTRNQNTVWIMRIFSRKNYSCSSIIIELFIVFLLLLLLLLLVSVTMI